MSPLRLGTDISLIMIINGMLHALLTLFTTNDDDANKHIITFIYYSLQCVMITPIPMTKQTIHNKDATINCDTY